MIPLGGAGGEVVQAVGDQDRSERAGRADQRTRGLPHRDERDDDGDLGQRVKRIIGAEHAVHGFGHPPRQRRQLVVAELPFAAVDHGLDHIERQVEIDQRRQHRPDQPVNNEEASESRLRAAFHRIDQSGHFHCVIGPQSCVALDARQQGRLKSAPSPLVGEGGEGVGRSYACIDACDPPPDPHPLTPPHKGEGNDDATRGPCY